MERRNKVEEIEEGRKGDRQGVEQRRDRRRGERTKNRRTNEVRGEWEEGKIRKEEGEREREGR